MATSQNGWLVLDDDIGGPQPTQRNWHIPGVHRDIPLRDGSAGFLLVHFATWFSHNIENIDIGYDDWGWAPRRIAGSDEWSNHASGTAIDLNADRHPAGTPVLQTFRPGQANKIRTRLQVYHGCLRWGGDYFSWTDSMHFEINAAQTAVVQRAQELCVKGTLGKQVIRENPGAWDVIH